MPNTLTPTHPRKATRSRSRRGSILIFVVGVLVLLAVIATAYLATSRNDRVSTQQNAYNTQVDLLLQGVVNAAKATIVGDLFDANVYRPLSGSTGTPKKYDAFDMPSYWTAPPANSTTNGLASPPENTLQTDPWLAPRVPVLLDPTKPFDATPTGTPAAPANPGIWRAVSASVLPGQRFESPYRQPGFNGPLIYDNRTNLLPESVLINGRKLPAFRLNLPDDAGTIQTGVFVLAGDADGDGQADSMLFKLPVGQLAGVTYYGATRTIDNNSAVNVNTAMSRDFDFFGDQKSGIASGYFTSGVGLLEMLKTYSAQSYDSAINAYGGELTNQLLYKFNSGGGIPGVLDPGNPPTGTPFDDTGAARNDFFYRSYGDALQSQLGRRLDNPGSLDAGTKFRAFGLGDASALAARFTLRDSSGSTEPVETALNPSLLTGTRGTPYVADDANTVGTNGWFDSLFNYTKENSLASATFLPRRALLVTDNPLSNLASPLKTAAGGLPPTASTSAGTLAQMTAIPADGIVNKVPINGQRPLLTDPNYTRDNFSDAWRAYWSVMAEPDFTGTGDDLGTSFSPIYAAMKTAKGPNYYQNPYIGTEFFSEYVAPAVPPAPPVTGAPYDPVTTATDDTAAGMGPAGAPEQHPNRMFRSPLRATAIAAGGDATAPPTWNNETARLPSDQVVLLRSAIAAINLQSAREQSDAIGTNTVRLAVNVAGAQKFAQATVFGQKRQPFISEIYAQTDNVAPGPGGGQANPHGYIAIELVNPYPVAFDLQYCRLATLQRLRETSSADAADRYPNMQLRDRSAFGGMAATAQVDLGDTTGTTVKSNLADPTAFSSPMIIAPGGTLLLENYDASATDPDAARYRPVSSGLPATGPIANNAAPYQQANVVYVHNLHKLFDKEVVLMRPLGAGIGQTTVAAKPGTDTVQFQVTGTEGSPPILRFAPLDSYDFSGLILPGAPPDTDLPTPAVALTVTKATAWHYVRDVVNDNGFRAIYPGRYDANQSDEQRHPRQDTAGSFLPRQQGTDSAVAWTPGTETDQWDPASMAVPTNTAAPGPPDPPPSLGLPSDIASYPQTFTIHLALPFWPAGNNLQAVPNNIYPFGKFAKNSDLLQVPYIGGYVIRLEEYLNETISAGSNAHVLEVNAVTADSAFAEDTDPNDNPSLNTPESGLQAREQIGRFAPLAQSATAGGNVTGTPFIDDNYTTALQLMGSSVNQYGATPVANTTPPGAGRYNDFALDSTQWRYHFGRKLFDYFEIQSPQADYFPNVAPQQYGYINPTTGAATALPTPARVSNSGLDVMQANVEQKVEKLEPINGLVNINTAPHKVLAMLPWVERLKPGTFGAGNDGDYLTIDQATGTVTVGSNGVSDNDEIAYAIVLWRDGNFAAGIPPKGPFVSMFDIYRVPVIRAVQGLLIPTNPSSVVLGQYLMLGRVSNLISMRSDSYTVYVLVQGWKNVDTAEPELVVERRAALIVDRSGVTPTNRDLTISTKVPVN